MRVSAFSRLTVLSMMACTSARLSTPEPVAAVVARACNTAFRWVSVTRCSPRRAKSATVSVLPAALPATARPTMRLAALASASMWPTVATSATLRSPIASLSSAKALAPGTVFWPASPMSAPMVAKSRLSVPP